MITKRTYQILLMALISFANNACVETFDFESEIETFESALVVEATITNELKTQEILLSRTFRLQEGEPSPENAAQVKIIDDTNTEYLFKESDSIGTYISTIPFAAKKDVNYTLQIMASDGKEYNSTPTKYRQNTEIDSLYAERKFNINGKEGMFIYVDSYDPTGSSKYYRYEYEETYRIESPLWAYENMIIISISPPIVDIVDETEEERVCYNTVASNTIIIENINEYSQDKMHRFPVRFINRNNYILQHRYSILVRQYVQSREAYVFYETLKRFSEVDNLLYQEQPGFFQGNVFSVPNNNEKVLGFFDVSSVDVKRIFFNYEDFFPDEQIPPFITNCDDFFTPKVYASETHDAVPPVSPLIQALLEGMEFYRIADSFYDVEGDAAPFVLVRAECGNCNYLGSNIVPEFWIE